MLSAPDYVTDTVSDLLRLRFRNTSIGSLVFVPAVDTAEIKPGIIPLFVV
jgi:hypothetical protein